VSHSLKTLAGDRYIDRTYRPKSGVYFKISGRIDLRDENARIADGLAKNRNED
jgi:hypothetical protein